MNDPIRVPLQALVAIHAELIAEHGGLAGPPPRQGDLAAALGRPVNLHGYSETPVSLPRLGAGELSEDQLADWIAANSAALS